MINSTEQWDQLTSKQKKYAYYMDKAAWAGTLIVPHQMSYEAPPLFVLLQAFFSDKSTEELTKYIVNNKTGVSKDEFLKFKAYSASFFTTYGNYRQYGSKKFIPEVNSTVFKKILDSSPFAHQNGTKGKLYQQLVKELYPQIEKEIFSLDGQYKSLGYPSDGGITAYFSLNMTKPDLEKV